VGVGQVAAVQVLAQRPWGSLRAQRLPLRRVRSFCVGACVGVWRARLRVRLLAFRRQALPQQWLFRALARSRLRARRFRAQARRSCVGACAWRAALPLRGASQRRLFRVRWAALLGRQPPWSCVGACVWARFLPSPLARSARSPPSLRRLRAQARQFCVGACARRALTRVQSASPPVPAPTRSARSA